LTGDTAPGAESGMRFSTPEISVGELLGFSPKGRQKIVSADMKRSVIKGMVEILLAGLPVIMALDLLYLYFAGSWYDPVRWIELTEVAALVIMSLVYLGLFIFKITQYRGKTLNSKS
jgi:hypothetical protein